MATITIPKVRKETDVMMYVKLTDNGVTVDWTSLSEVVAFMYSNEQDCIAGQCETAIAAGDPSTLNVRYTTMAPQFLGVNSLLIRCTYDGMQKSFDVPVLEFVDRTAEATGQVTLDDPELPVSIEVTDVDTSLLDEAIAAALDAAAAAAAAAALVPLDVLTQCQEATIACQDATAHASPIIGENGNWKYYDPETGEYVDSELPSRGIQGPQGEQGPQGIQGNTGSSVDYPFELVNNRTTDDATKALSAAEGKRLGDDLSQLDQEVNGSDQSFINPVANAWSTAIPCKLDKDVTYIISTALSSGTAVLAPTNSSGAHVQADEITRITYVAGSAQSMEYTPAVSSDYMWIYAGGDFPQYTKVSIVAKNGGLRADIQANADAIAAVKESLSYEQKVEADVVSNVVQFNNLNTNGAAGFQHLEFAPIPGARYLLSCVNINSTFCAAFLNDGAGHYIKLLVGSDNQVYNNEPVQVPSAAEITTAGLTLANTKLYVNNNTTKLGKTATAVLVGEVSGQQVVDGLDESVAADASINAKIIKISKTFTNATPAVAAVFPCHIEKGITYTVRNLNAAGVQVLRFLDKNRVPITDENEQTIEYSFYSTHKYVENHRVTFVASFTAEYVYIYPNAEAPGVGLSIVGGLADVFDLSDISIRQKELRESLIAAQYMRPMNAGCELSIIGDSISTFGQKEYCYYYNAQIQAAQYPDFDVAYVEQCYWYQLLRRQCCDLGANYSYNGSCVTEGLTSLPTFPDRAAIVPASTDICVVAMGTNDSNGGATLGTYDWESAAAELDDTTFIGAYTKGIKLLLETNPGMQILCVVLKMTDTYATAIQTIAEHFNLFYVDARGYTTADGMHPNAQGMMDIYKTINDYLSGYYLN